MCVCSGVGGIDDITELENQGPPHLLSLERAKDVKNGILGPWEWMGASCL